METKNQVLALFLLLAFLVTPFVGFAKDNDDTKSVKNNEEKSEGKIERDEDKNETNKENETSKKEKNEKENRGCFRAIGHLIAPGWIKHNGPINWSKECRLPFGIGKKLNDNGTSTPPVSDINDTTAPAISEITFKLTSAEAVVLWKTDEKSDSAVFWDTDGVVETGVGAKVVSDGGFVRDHEMTLKNLAKNTKYFVVIRSRDASGSASVSNTLSFTTNDSSAPVIKDIQVIDKYPTIASIMWNTNEPTSSKLSYSVKSSLDSESAIVLSDKSFTTKHQFALSGLIANTTYYYKIMATDYSGNVSESAVLSFKTTAPLLVDQTAPVISSSFAFNIGINGANIGWPTNELSDSKVWLSKVAPVDTSGLAGKSSSELVLFHNVRMDGLSANTKYYFAVSSKDKAGNESIKSTGSFTTSSLITSS